METSLFRYQKVQRVNKYVAHCSCGVAHPVDVLVEGSVALLSFVCDSTDALFALPVATSAVTCDHADCRLRVEFALAKAVRLAAA